MERKGKKRKTVTVSERRKRRRRENYIRWGGWEGGGS